jgi:hypothetical protein
LKLAFKVLSLVKELRGLIEVRKLLEILSDCNFTSPGKTPSHEQILFSERFSCSMLVGISHISKIEFFDKFSFFKYFNNKSSGTATVKTFPDKSSSIYLTFTKFLNLSRPNN